MINKTNIICLSDRLSQKYNPDGECRLDCIDNIISFFEKKNINIENARDTYSTIKLLKKMHMHYYIYFPIISLLSPYNLLLFIKEIQYSSIFSSILKKREHNKDIKKYSVLYYLTFHQLYNLAEKYTHCVAIFHVNDKNIYYDPLLETINKEYDLKLNPPAIKTLGDFLSIKILIWE